MHRKFPKASNLANTMNVMQIQVLQNYEFLPNVIIQYTMHCGSNVHPPFFPTLDFGVLLQTPKT